MPRKNQSSAASRTVALCYIRQSFTRDGDDNASPERQRANIEAICQRNGWTAEWYEDAEGHRSGRFVRNRPAWLALEKRLFDPDVAALVANDLSRLHRKAWRIGKLIDTVDELGIRLILATLDYEFDTANPIGQMMLTMLAVQDEAYANDISRRVKNSISYRKTQGKTVGRPPFGTQHDDDGYLIPADEGAWLLPDGHFAPGMTGEESPVPGAQWRGYYDCAYRILDLDGDMTREEYLLVKEHNEREIAHWEARTTETEAAALELKMCMDAVARMATVWDSSSDEDRQQLAAMLFEHLVYDLNTRRIVDFRLKP